jgi:hypothetical protein
MTFDKFQNNAKAQGLGGSECSASGSSPSRSGGVPALSGSPAPNGSPALSGSSNAALPATADLLSNFGGFVGIGISALVTLFYHF